LNQSIRDKLIKYSILRIGEVCEIEGKKIYVLLDKNKNASDLLYNGTVLKNVSVGSFIEVKKGFLSIICKVDGEKLVDEYISNTSMNKKYINIDRNKRILSASVSGFIEANNRFSGGIKELPLIGNEVFILTERKIHLIHRLLRNETALKISIAKTDKEDIPIEFPIDGLFNSHIAIFGNTGSGKSNTLVSLYQAVIKKLITRKNFNNCRFFIFDFNGEFTGKNCIWRNKTIFNLSTVDNEGDKIPMKFDELMNIENISLLFDATEKTQRPFLNRALRYYRKFIKEKEDCTDKYYEHFVNTIKHHIKKVLVMSNKDVGLKIIDYLIEILKYFLDVNTIQNNVNFHDTNKYFYLIKDGSQAYDNNFQQNPQLINDSYLMTSVVEITEQKLMEIPVIHLFYIFIILQFIDDLSRFQVQIDHILPLISRYKSKRSDIEKIFVIDENNNIWNKSNIIVLNMLNINIEMKKAVPLLMAKCIYNTHKKTNKKKNDKSLSMIIDEAHNILSKESFREKEDWKDYRLETFEEIIKEGRKFGVFVTISSQRPNDISETIISQAHNYFIHQLINQNDLRTIGNAVSYIDRVTEESIPTLPVGTCIFSGIATPMPLKIKIDELNDDNKPQSQTLKFEDITNEDVIYL
jgi:hypothetical protein